MADPSIDPSLARPASQDHHHHHLHQPHGVPSSDIFNTYEGGPDPATYQLAAAALHGANPVTTATATTVATGDGKWQTWCQIQTYWSR